MTTKIPCLLLGDGPAEPTGLGRIARDLAHQLLTSDLPLDLVQVGGSTPPVWTSWRHVPLDREVDWGVKNVEAIYQSLWGDQPGILFAVWDPARLYAYSQFAAPVKKWAYVAIDGANVNGRVSGPAEVALQAFDRVLAYNRYGAGILKATLSRDVQWLPHGLATQTYRPVTEAYQEWARRQLGPHAIGRQIVGCVMTNQPRKDFGLLFESLGVLVHGRQWPLHLWLHTDELIKAWSVQQLVEDFGLAKRVTVTGLEESLTDQQLAALYQQCAVTVLPSLGEGFGYPIVESLASGVPVVHSQWGGGESYVPKLEWRVPVRERRLESVYAIERPVMRPADWANAIERALRWRQEETEAVVQAYCRGSVAHLDWQAIWPRWYAWFKQGLQ